MPQVEFCYDVVCPWAYIASTRIEAVAARNNATIKWTPVLLGGIYRLVEAPQGKDGSASDVMNATKKAVSANDLRLTLSRWKVPAKFHPSHPVRSVNALRMLCMAPENLRSKLTHALYKAYWVDNLDIANMDVIVSIAKQNGFNVTPDIITSSEAKKRLEDNTNYVVSMGAPGVPSFIVEDKLFWGQDRLHFVDKALGNRNAQQKRVVPRTLPNRPPITLTVFHDFASPWSYIGSTQIERVVREAGPHVKIEYVPILLGALFKEIGTPNVPMLAISETRRQYGAADMQEWLAWWGGVELNFPTFFPIRTVLPLRVSIVEPKVIHILYNAAWVKNQNIGEADDLKQILDEAGFNGEELIKKAQSQEVKDRLSANTRRATENGVCGVPTYQINGGNVIWGQDRLDLVGDLLAGWDPEAASARL